MVGWVREGTEFPPDATLPDGTRPAELIAKWGPWVQEAVDLMDADGALVAFPHGLQRSEEPAVDMDVLRAIRGEWVRLENERIRAQTGGG